MLVFADNYNTNSCRTNKWKNHKYHKQNNRIQRSSKQKYPIKQQQKHAKRSNIQKQRTQIYEQLTFELCDYNEYEYKHEYSYYQYEYECNYNSDFHSDIPKRQNDTNNEFESRFDGIDVNIKYYCIGDIYTGDDDIITEWNCPRCTLIQSNNDKTCRLCFQPQPRLWFQPQPRNINSKNKKSKQQIIYSAGTDLKIYKNNVNIETKNTELSMINFDVFHSFLECKAPFKNIKNTLTETIINKSINVFKGNVQKGNILKLFKGIKTNKIVKNMDIHYTYSSNNNNQKLNLSDILYEIIPNLWFIYDYLCEYIGYKCLNIFVSATATIRNLKTLRYYPKIIQKSKTLHSGHGITYYEKNETYTNIKYTHLYCKDYINENRKEHKHKRNKSKHMNTDYELGKLYNELHTLRDKKYALKLKIFQLELYTDAQFIPKCLRKNVTFPKWCLRKNVTFPRRCYVRNTLWKGYYEADRGLRGRISRMKIALHEMDIEYKKVSKKIIEYKLSKLENGKKEFKLRNNFVNKCKFKELIKEKQLKKDQQKILLNCDRLFTKIHLKINGEQYVKLLEEARTNEKLLFMEKNNEGNDINETEEIEDKIYLISNDIYDDYYSEVKHDLDKYCYYDLAYIDSVNLDEKIRRKIVNKFGSDTDKNQLEYRNKAIINYEKFSKNNKS